MHLLDFFGRIYEKNCPLLALFEAVRPHLQLSFENILAHINTIYVLKTKAGVMSKSERYLRLKVRGKLWCLEMFPIAMLYAHAPRPSALYFPGTNDEETVEEWSGRSGSFK